MPTSKIIPSKVEKYAISEVASTEIKKELDNIKSEEIVKTYTIDSSDLEVYEKTNKYNKGKVNPFEQYRVNTQEETTESSSNSGSSSSNTKNTNTSSSSSSTNNNSNSTNNQSSSNSGGTFLNTQGK